MKKSIDEVIQTYQTTKSIRKTATLTGYSKSGIEYILKNNSIALFPKNRKGKESSASKAIDSLDKSNPRKLVRDKIFMTDLYLVKKMSVPEIAAKLGIGRTTVITGLEQCGIERRSKRESVRGKARPNAQGSKNRNWKGGITGWRKLARGRLNEHFVRPVMQRDNFKCQWCRSNKKLVVHHHQRTFMEIVEIVKGRCSDSDVEVFVKEIVKEHSLQDGITLCKNCHDNFHMENGK